MTALALLAGLSIGAAQGPVTPIGEQWGAVQLRSTDGQTVEWRPGRVAVFSFCAYWCVTWKSQVPKLVEARSALQGLPVDFRTISIDGRWAELAKTNGGLPLWLDPGGSWSRSVGIDQVPTTVVLNPSGRVTFASTGVVRREELLRAVRSALAEEEAKVGPLYLTFDDFPPLDGSGEELLDVLRASGVKATLFCLASRLEANARLIRRAKREGHSVQCHSWDHDASRPQLDRCQAAFRAVLGAPYRLYRAPGSERIVGLDTQPPVIDPYDFNRPGERELLRRILFAAKPGGQVQLHAGVRETIDALPTLVQKLGERGYTFDAL